MEKLKALDYTRLKQASETNDGIGCPFSHYFGGKIFSLNNYPTGREERESKCLLYCGKMFGERYKANKCPCWHLGKSYTKKTFWQKLEEVRKED